jgi:hypothetical protein
VPPDSTEPQEPNPCPCLLCRPGCTGHVGDNRRVCGPHRDRLRRDLEEVPSLYALLRAELIRRPAAGPKVSGSRAAPVPGNLDVLNLRGPGSLTLGVYEPEDQHGATPVFAALEAWERDWRDHRGLAITGVWRDLPTAVAAIVRFLVAHLDWACDHHDAIDEVRDAMKAARGDRPELTTVGRCPATFDGAVCGEKLRASTWSDVIRCQKCHAQWSRPAWEHLGIVIRENEREQGIREGHITITVKPLPCPSCRELIHVRVEPDSDHADACVPGEVTHPMRLAYEHTCRRRDKAVA